MSCLDEVIIFSSAAEIEKPLSASQKNLKDFVDCCGHLGFLY